MEVDDNYCEESARTQLSGLTLEETLPIVSVDNNNNNAENTLTKDALNQTYGPVLYDLLFQYYNQNTNPEYSDRIKHVINALFQLRHYHKDKANAVINDPDNAGKRLAYVVVWYDSPMELWHEKTYATFIVSFCNQFFNPLVNLQVLGTFFDEVSGEEKRAVSDQFGRVLKFVHKESPYLRSFLAKLLGNNTQKVNLLLRPKTKPESIFRAIIETWINARAKCNMMRQQEEHVGQITESLMKSNIKLLSTGLGISTLLAEVLLQDYVTKTNYIGKSVYADETHNKEVAKENTLSTGGGSITEVVDEALPVVVEEIDDEDDEGPVQLDFYDIRAAIGANKVEDEEEESSIAL